MSVHSCTRCELLFATAAEASDHERHDHGVEHSTPIGEYRHREAPGIDPPNAALHCPECGLWFADGTQLVLHRSKEHPESGTRGRP